MSALPLWSAPYIGIPFAEKGRTRAGCDCWGAVRLVLEEHFGYDRLPDFGDAYTSSTDKESVARAVESGLLHGWERVDSPSARTLVILRLAGRPWHCAVMLNCSWMLHAVANTGTVAEQIDTLLWRNRVEGFYRYAGE